MTRIKNLVDKIKDEVCDAKEYAEEYLAYKSKTTMPNYMNVANRYKEMSNDELKHSMYLHDVVSQEIADLQKIYTPPTEMMDMWDKEHKLYVEKVAWVKQMLAM